MMTQERTIKTQSDLWLECQQLLQAIASTGDL
jgi:hypothetical protein